MNEKLKGHIVILCATVMFGVNIPISKSLLETIGPFGWSFMRAFFACLCFWIASLFLPRERLASVLLTNTRNVCSLPVGSDGAEKATPHHRQYV
ncbi:MAG: EamA family transporter [Tannerella sp.]|nr:EamA family transporter [Tannerella sp.]